MVEEVEKLGADPQHPIFPVLDFRILHDREIEIDVTGSAKTVAALREAHQAAIAHSRRAQMSGIEARLAATLHKECPLSG